MIVINEEFLSRLKGAANRATRGRWQTFPSRYCDSWLARHQVRTVGCLHRLADQSTTRELEAESKRLGVPF